MDVESALHSRPIHLDDNATKTITITFEKQNSKAHKQH